MPSDSSLLVTKKSYWWQLVTCQSLFSLFLLQRILWRPSYTRPGGVRVWILESVLLVADWRRTSLNSRAAWAIGQVILNRSNWRFAWELGWLSWLHVPKISKLGFDLGPAGDFVALLLWIPYRSRSVNRGSLRFWKFHYKSCCTNHQNE